MVFDTLIDFIVKIISFYYSSESYFLISLSDVWEWVRQGLMLQLNSTKF